MANTLIVKRSSQAGKEPTSAQLQVGEIAVNLADRKIYTKNAAGEVILIGSGAAVDGNIGFEVKNQTGTTLPKGTLVGFAGTLGSSGRLLVAPFLANGSGPSEYCVGVLSTDIPDGGDGFAVDHGKITGLNTSAFTEGTILYASATTAGQLTSARPVAPNNKITVAAVVNSSTTTGVLEIRVTLGSQLGNDELVELNSLANGHVLRYNSSTNRFENTAQTNLAAGTANTLATARTINGVSFDGASNITTANWGTARNLTIGNTTKSVNGSNNVSWSLSEIGAGDVALTAAQTLTNKTLGTGTAITAGTINGATIGATAPSSGAFTTISYTGTLTGGTGVVNLGSGQFYKDVSGNVGIGTSSPVTRLDVSGTASMTSYKEGIFTITDGTTVNLDPNNGSIQTWTLGANRTPGQANWAAGQSITLMIDDGTARTITWSTLAVVWTTDGGTAPTLNTTGFTVIALWKVGTTIYGARVGDT
jgi:hypothetical protein